MKKLLTILTVLAISAGTLLSASAAFAGTLDQCLITTNGTDKSGYLVVTSDTCYSSFGDVLTAAGVHNVPSGITGAQAAPFIGPGTGIIAVHYDGSNGSGATLTIQGVDCNGGGLNLPGSWNDKISSTLNGCPTIRHYHDSNFTGTEYDTFGVNSLSNIGGSMNNQTTSVIYTS